MPAPVGPLRALLVSYSFPPVGGAGVQRVAKLVKYLPRHGVRPAVLTVANPSVPLRDESLLRDVPAGIEVTRTWTLEPGYGAKRAAWQVRARETSSGAADRHGESDPSKVVRGRAGAPSTATRIFRATAGLARDVLFPDPQVLWQPSAQVALAARIAAARDDVVLVSAPPFSQFLLGPLARAGGLGLVLDYRDEWSTVRSAYEMSGSRLSCRLADALEAALLRRAHRVVTATDEFRAALLERFPFVDPGRVVGVPNGYDPDDFPGDAAVPPSDRFVVSYGGTVFSLTSVRGLLSAVRLLHRRSPQRARRLRLRFLGRIADTELDAFDATEELGVERDGYVPHRRVLRELAASHMTLCVLDDVPGSERIYPAKIFELMHLGRPVLTLAPPGSALARLAERHRLGPLVHPRDEEAIASALEAHLDRFDRGEYAADSWQNASGIDRYDRRALAGEFAEILRTAAADAGRRRS